MAHIETDEHYRARLREKLNYCTVAQVQHITKAGFFPKLDTFMTLGPADLDAFGKILDTPRGGSSPQEPVFGEAAAKTLAKFESTHDVVLVGSAMGVGRCAICNDRAAVCLWCGIGCSAHVVVEYTGEVRCAYVDAGLRLGGGTELFMTPDSAVVVKHGKYDKAELERAYRNSMLGVLGKWILEERVTQGFFEWKNREQWMHARMKLTVAWGDEGSRGTVLKYEVVEPVLKEVKMSPEEVRANMDVLLSLAVLEDVLAKVRVTYAEIETITDARSSETIPFVAWLRAGKSEVAIEFRKFMSSIEISDAIDSAIMRLGYRVLRQSTDDAYDAATKRASIRHELEQLRADDRGVDASLPRPDFRGIVEEMHEVTRDMLVVQSIFDRRSRENEESKRVDKL